MAQQELVLVGSGVLGASQGVGVFVASIINPGPGRWKIWGTVRHSLADAIRLRIASNNIIPRVPQNTNEVAPFGPIYFDILNYTDDIILDLATATGVSDSASGIIYAQRTLPI